MNLVLPGDHPLNPGTGDEDFLLIVSIPEVETPKITLISIYSLEGELIREKYLDFNKKYDEYCGFANQYCTDGDYAISPYDSKSGAWRIIMGYDLNKKVDDFVIYNSACVLLDEWPNKSELPLNIHGYLSFNTSPHGDYAIIYSGCESLDQVTLFSATGEKIASVVIRWWKPNTKFYGLADPEGSNDEESEDIVWTSKFKRKEKGEYECFYFFTSKGELFFPYQDFQTYKFAPDFSSVEVTPNVYDPRLMTFASDSICGYDGTKAFAAKIKWKD